MNGLSSKRGPASTGNIKTLTRFLKKEGSDYAKGRRSVISLAVGGCLLTSALIHLLVTPEHWHEAPHIGFFFGASAAVLMGLAVAILTRPARGSSLLGVLVPGSLIVLYFMTRTWDLPLVPEREAYDSLGLLAKAVEGLAIVGSWLLLSGGRSRSTLEAGDPSGGRVYSTGMFGGVYGRPEENGALSSLRSIGDSLGVLRRRFAINKLQKLGGLTMKRIAALCALALLASALTPALSAQAQTSYNIDVGADLSRNRAARGAPADPMRFYAPTMRVHTGDTIKFAFKAFHTATLLPANVSASSWVAQNAGGVGKAFSLLEADRDDGGTQQRPALKAKNASIFPPRDCGAADNPCVYTGAGVVNSGIGFFAPKPEFNVRIGAAPGTTIWVVCLVHPDMRLRINVVDAASSATSQQQINSYRARQTLDDATRAGKLHHKLLNKKTKKRVGNRVVWRAFAGVDGNGFALLGFYPKKLVIRKGESVRWSFSRLIFEDHTVTFPFSQAQRAGANFFAPSCDPDGDAGPGPDTPPSQQNPPFCSDPRQLELDIPPDLAYKRGDGVFNGNDFQNSGMWGAGIRIGSNPFRLQFARVSPRKGFRYMCLIHGAQMSGAVVVKKRR